MIKMTRDLSVCCLATWICGGAAYLTRRWLISCMQAFRSVISRLNSRHKFDVTYDE